MKNGKEIFNIALGLQPPRQISDIKFEARNKGKELHIYLYFEKGSKFISEDGKGCTSLQYGRNDLTTSQFFEHKCLHTGKGIIQLHRK
ncbi:MAG TPA: hypothetical protein ENI76_01335 [Ignavibacteria bacterium]|nr:hypothetical protein [Ignavibacteria bacterium]